MRISLLVPSRGRPHRLSKLIESVHDTRARDVEFIVRLDKDDETAGDYPEIPYGKYMAGDRCLMSDLWNDCYRAATGDILWHGGDDVIFRTDNWDEIVRNAFPSDRIAFVHGDDLGDRGVSFGTHGFLSREWVETVGYFTPPYFSADYNDRWFNDIANILDRRYYRSFVTEHEHPGFGKAPMDATYEETEQRSQRDRPYQTYASLADRRLVDATKLLAKMDR